MSKSILISQPGGSRINASIDKAALKLLPQVASHNQLYTESNWGMVSFVYKHTLSSRRLVASFKGSFDAQTTMKIRSGMNSGDEFHLKKIIISGPGRQPMLILSRSQIENVAQLDFILGAVDQPNPSYFGVFLSSTSPNVVDGAYSVSVLFNKPVTGFSLSDIIVTGNAEVSNLSGSGANYTFEINPFSDGNISVQVASQMVLASDGSTNLFSNVIQRTYSGPATVSFSTDSGIFPGPFQVTASFNKPVSNFSLTDISILNGIASNLSGSGTTYTFTVTPVSDGAVSVGINSNIAQPSQGSGGSLNVEYSSPATSSVSSLATSVIYDGFTVSANFDKPVTGFSISDIFVTNGVVSNLSGSGTSYTFDVVPTQAGIVQVKILENVGSSFSQESNMIEVSYTVPELLLESEDPLIYIKEMPALSLNAGGISLSPSGSFLISGSGTLTSATDLVSSYVTKSADFNNEIEYVPDMSEYKVVGSLNPLKDEYKFERQKLSDGSFYAKTISSYGKSVSSNELEMQEKQIRKISNLNNVVADKTIVGQTSQYLVVAENSDSTGLNYKSIKIVDKNNNSVFSSNNIWVDSEVHALYDPREDVLYFAGYESSNTNMKKYFYVAENPSVQHLEVLSNTDNGLYYEYYSLINDTSRRTQSALVYEDGYMKPFFCAAVLQNPNSADKTVIKMFKIQIQKIYYDEINQFFDRIFSVVPAFEIQNGLNDDVQDLFSINEFTQFQNIYDSVINSQSTSSNSAVSRLFFVAKSSNGYFAPHMYNSNNKTFTQIGSPVSWDNKVFGSWKIANIPSTSNPTGLAGHHVFFLGRPINSSIIKVCSTGMNATNMSYYFCRSADSTGADNPQQLVSAGSRVYFSGNYSGSVRKLYSINLAGTSSVGYQATAILNVTPNTVNNYSGYSTTSGTSGSLSISDNIANIIPVAGFIIFSARNAQGGTKLFSLWNNQSSVRQMTNTRSPQSQSDSATFLGYVSPSVSDVSNSYIYISAVSPDAVSGLTVTKLHKILITPSSISVDPTVVKTEISVDVAARSDSFSISSGSFSMPLINGRGEGSAHISGDAVQHAHTGLATISNKLFITISNSYVAVGPVTTSPAKRLYELNGTSEKLISDTIKSTFSLSSFSVSIANQTESYYWYHTNLNTNRIFYNDGYGDIKKAENNSGSWTISTAMPKTYCENLYNDFVYDSTPIKYGNSFYFYGQNEFGSLKLIRFDGSTTKEVSPNRRIYNDLSYVLGIYENYLYFVCTSEQLRGTKLFSYNTITDEVTNITNIINLGNDFDTDLLYALKTFLVDPIERTIFFTAYLSGTQQKLFVLSLNSGQVSVASNCRTNGSDQIANPVLYNSKVYFTSYGGTSSSITKVWVCEKVSSTSYESRIFINTSGSTSVSDDVEVFIATGDPALTLFENYLFFRARTANSSSRSLWRVNLNNNEAMFTGGNGGSSVGDSQKRVLKNVNGIPTIYFFDVFSSYSVLKKVNALSLDFASELIPGFKNFYANSNFSNNSYSDEVQAVVLSNGDIACGSVQKSDGTNTGQIFSYYNSSSNSWTDYGDIIFSSIVLRNIRYLSEEEGVAYITHANEGSYFFDINAKSYNKIFFSGSTTSSPILQNFKKINGDLICQVGGGHNKISLVKKQKFNFMCNNQFLGRMFNFDGENKLFFIASNSNSKGKIFEYS